MKLQALISAAFLAASSAMASASVVNVDLSGATSGTSIDGVGASFSSLFVGQSLSGPTGLGGTPTGPLSLATGNLLSVVNFDPGVSAQSNSILPAPTSSGPLSILLDEAATSLTFTAGFGNNGTAAINFYDENGGLVASSGISFGLNYRVFTFSGLGTFSGVSIFDNNDPAGARYQNFSFDTAAAIIPLPAGGLLLLTALGGIAVARRRARA